MDDFSSLAIEKCLLDPLLTIFGPGTVEIMAGDVVRDIASEDERTTVERDRLTEKKMVLEKALARLQRLDRNNLAGWPPSTQLPVPMLTSSKYPEIHPKSPNISMPN